MKSIRKFLNNRKAKVGLSVAGLMFALALTLAPLGQGYSSQYSLAPKTVLAACPEVPADCTIDDVVGDTADSVFDTTVATLVSNLPAIVAGATILMVGFALIKLVFRWARKFIH